MVIEQSIKASRGWISINFREIWRYRELLFMLIKRDVQGKYRQSVLGFTWAFLPPVMQMVVFTFIFGNVAKLGPDGLPYPVFSLAALVPWTFFSRALTSASSSMIGGKGLITKVYFPRLILPITGVFSALVDFGIASIVLFVLMGWYGILPGIAILALPGFILISMLTALAVGLWMTALSIKYRDVNFVAPFFIQLWMYITPVIFAVEKIPEKYQIYLWLNPMTGVIEGFRWALLGQSAPEWHYMGISMGVVLLLLLGGLFYFRKMERTFADLI